MTEPSAALQAALAQHQAGHIAEAEAAYRSILSQTPQDADALHFLGLALFQQGRPADGLVEIRKAVSLSPERPTFLYNRGIVATALGFLDEAADALQQTTALDPDNGPAWASLGTVLGRQRRYPEGLAALDRANQIAPGQPAVASGRSACLWGMKRYADALAAAEQAIATQPDLAEAHQNRGNALQSLGRLEEAEQAFLKSLDLLPANADVAYNLGNLYHDWGRAQEALTYLALAHEQNPGHTGIADNWLMCRLYGDEETEQSLYDSHVAVAERCYEGDASPSARIQDAASRPLRVGYVSGDFKRHSCTYFFEPVLDNHDPARVTAYCYSMVNTPDAVTERLMAKAPFWRDVRHADDEALLAQIKSDGIDILVDMSGHTLGNRLRVFARRAAPVQVAWLGYPATTGVAAMDWRLTDAHADPEGDSDQWHTEKLYRLAPCFHAYRPPDDAPDVSPLPAKDTGQVTFGSFNNLAKVTPGVVAVWADILKAVPGSRLALKGKMLDGDGAREHFRRLFAQHGIGDDRLWLMGWVARDANPLSAYHHIDIALDPFPYNGTTTTCEALWMGVPVVTLSGQRHAARVGASLLHAIKQNAWVTDNEADYKNMAVSLAADITALEERRAGLRDQVQSSPLGDEKGFTQKLEDAYRFFANGN